MNKSCRLCGITWVWFFNKKGGTKKLNKVHERFGRLKQKGYKHDWKEIVRTMNTQKCVTTTMDNINSEKISIRKIGRICGYA